jgi:arylsulfatase
VEAVVHITTDDPSGILCAIGDWTQGWALYVLDGRLAFCLNVAGVAAFARSDRSIPTGSHTLGVRLDVVAGGGLTLTLLQDGSEVGSGTSEHGVPVGMMQVGGTGLCIGYDRGFPVTDEYSTPFRFTGEIEYVTVEVPAPAAPDPRARIAQALHED